LSGKFTQTGLERIDRAADGPGDLRDLLGAEKQQPHNADDEKFSVS